MSVSLEKKLLTGLNKTQKQAVTFGDGPLLVVAGAGSGKTRVITHRIAYMVAAGVSPEKILGITFTNKAAAEMERRVSEMAGAGVTIKTFHAFCAMLLRRSVHHLGYDRSFTIYDRSDSLRVVRRRCKTFDLDPSEYKPGDILNGISAHKDRLESPREAAEKAEGEWDRQLVRVYDKYEEELAENNALDFDDLLFKTVQLFREHPEVLKYFQEKYEYIMVDEYQDTNLAQHVIAKALQGRHRNITAVGDPDQTIYTWRGARMENVMDFEKEFPGGTIIRLERNYRSTANILRAASHAVSHNVNRYEKRLFTDEKCGPPVVVGGHPGAPEEATWVSKKIRALSDGGRSMPTIGVLYRTKHQSGEFEKVFAQDGISYQLVDTIGFFERKAVKDIAAYLHVIVNPKDQIALRRIINVPSRGIGARTLQRIEKIAASAGKQVLEAILDSECRNALPPRAARAVGGFAEMFGELQNACRNAQSIRDAVEKVIVKTKYMSSVKKEDREETEELLDYFLGFAEQYQLQNPDADLQGFMEQSVLASDVDGWSPETGTVSMMTLHAAKGLEFDVVFLAGVENSILPHSRALEDRTSMDGDEAMEEERRLFHVGMTRARKQLFLSYASERMIRGKFENTGESSFLMELPNEGVSWERVASKTRRWGNSYRYSRANSRKGNVGGRKKKAAVKRPPKKNAPSDTARKLDGVAPGKEISHNIYGEGTVISVTNMGKKKLMKVDFARYEEPLTILE